MKKITYDEMIAAFKEYNNTHPTSFITGIVVLDESNFDNIKLSRKERSFRVYSNDPGIKGTGEKILAHFIDSDKDTFRLDECINDIQIEYCYLEQTPAINQKSRNIGIELLLLFTKVFFRDSYKIMMNRLNMNRKMREQATKVK